jgi:hypothetical protein
MIEALKLSDTKLSDVDTFLATLLAEHDAQGVLAQLTNIWIVNVLLILREEDDTVQAEGAAGLGTRGLDAMWPRPHRIGRERLRMETETEKLKARGMDCRMHWVLRRVPRMAPWARAPGWFCMPAARQRIAINTLKPNQVWNSTE